MKKIAKCMLVTIILAMCIIIVIQTSLDIDTSVQTSAYNLQTTDAAAPGLPTIGNLYGANMREMYNFGDVYCAGYGWSLVRKNKKYEDNGLYLPDGGWANAHQANTYTSAGSAPMVQTIAYARWQGARGATLQQIVWSSWQWNSSNLVAVDTSYKISNSTIGIAGRAQQFANFVYRGLDGSESLGLKCTPTTDETKDIKVLVDQGAATYVQGPYTATITNQSVGCNSGSESIGTLVWQEIIGINSGETEANRFANGTCKATITYRDGSKRDNVEITVLDSSGNPIQGNFPKFGEKFYIRYQSSVDEDVAEIKPNIKVTYMKKFKGNAYKYKSTHIKYKMFEDNQKLLEDAFRSKSHMDSSWDWVGNHHFWNTDGVTIKKGETINSASKWTNYYEPMVEGSLAATFTDKGINWDAHSMKVDITGHGGFYYRYNFYEEASMYLKVEQHKSMSTEPGWTVPGTGMRTTQKWEADSWRRQGFEVRDYTFETETIVYSVTLHIDGMSDNTLRGDCSSEDEAWNYGIDYIKKYVNWGCRITDVTIDEDTSKIQPAVVFDTPTGYRSATLDITVLGGNLGLEQVVLGSRKINMYIGGNAWQELAGIKTGDDGTGFRNGGNSLNYAGMQVELWDATKNNRVASCLTNSSGQYGFKNLNPMHKYYVVFTYDGMRFENTKYSDNLSGGYSTASESLYDGSERSNFNDKFDTIDTSPSNYSGKKAYGLYTKLVNSSDNYIQYSNEGTNQGSFRYYDALMIFKEICTDNHNYDRSGKSSMDNTYYSLGIRPIYADKQGEFYSRLSSIGVAGGEINSVWSYMMDTLIKSKTLSYPKQNQFVLDDLDSPLGGQPTYSVGTVYTYLYTQVSDQSRNVDFGVKLRQVADLWLSKDVYTATVLVNGKEHVYKYNKKTSETDSSGNWIVNTSRGDYEYSANSQGDSYMMANNDNYNGVNTYTRNVRKSEYLYDGSSVGTTDAKNLQAFVTYRIAVKNQSQSIYTSVNEIVDYFDTYAYTYDENYEIIKNGTYIGNSSGNKLYDLRVDRGSIYGSTGYNIIGTCNYGALYLTCNGSPIKNASGSDRLSPGEMTYVYITFKVNTDPKTGKVIINETFDSNYNNPQEGIGNRNIAEINGYSTYYNNGSKAGVIDVDSNPGSLRPNDLDANGNIKYSKTESWNNRLEDDTGKAPNIKILVKANDNGDTRSFSGYVFEDIRNLVSDAASVGNGLSESNDTKVNGVKVELVELVQEVNNQGFWTGEYLGEYVWSNVTYGTDWNVQSHDSSRYYSGIGSSKVILSGPGIFQVDSTNIGTQNGAYKFDSLPPGDFFVRFTYGDTEQTVRINDANNEVNQLLNDGNNGLNATSYNGQDYKSTTYQSGTTNSGTVTVDQNTSYNTSYTINGYNDLNNQNYINNVQELNNYNNAKNGKAWNQYTANWNGGQYMDKSKLYYYDIAGSEGKNVSDAKDVYGYREAEINWSKGSNSTYSTYQGQTLKNYRAEVMTSGTKLTTVARDDNKEIQSSSDNNKKADQHNTIAELCNNTYMVAQTGVIKGEVEKNRTYTEVAVDGSRNEDKLPYSVTDLLFGLEERPEAQVLLTKNLTNIQIKLADGRILFDTNQSVNNLSFGSHKIYEDKDYYYQTSDFRNNKTYRLRQDIMQQVKSRQEELVQAYMDEELMSGATIRLTYNYTIDNIGEVDYLDKQFYYRGKTLDAGVGNISRTNVLNVIDYVSNEAKYEQNYQDNEWLVTTTSELLGNSTSKDDDYVNSYYKDNLDTYNLLLRTRNFQGELIPRQSDTSSSKNYSRRETNLILTTMLSSSIDNKNLVYNNLAEVIETTNSVGRRMQISIAGNQKMAYQSDVKSEDESITWITPTEIDSDSAQKVDINVPTGANKNYVIAIIVSLLSLGIVGVSAILIRRNVIKKTEEENK